MAHEVYSTLDTMIAKYQKLGVLFFFCFVLYLVLFSAKSSTLQTVAQKGALETL